MCRFNKTSLLFIFLVLMTPGTSFAVQCDTVEKCNELALQSLELGYQSYLNGNYSDAFQYLTLSLEYYDAMGGPYEEKSIVISLRAVVALNLADHEQAEEDAEDAMELDEDQPFAYLANAYIAFFYYEDYEGTINILRNYVKFAKEPYFCSYQFCYYYLNGLSYFNLGWYENAINDLTVVVEADLADFDTFLARGLSYYATDRYREAARDLTVVIKMGGKTAEMYYFRANSYYFSGQYSGAIGDYLTALELGIDDKDLYYYLYHAYYYNRNCVAAVDGLTALMDAGNDDPELIYRRGNCYFYMNDFQNAVDDYTTYMDTNKASGLLHFVRGAAYYNMKKYDEAIPDFINAIKFRYTAVEYMHTFLAFSYYYKGDYDQAAAEFSNMLGMNLSKPKFCYLYRANAYFMKGDYDSAIADYENALAHDKKFVYAFFNRGNTYMMKGQYENAVNDYKQALRYRLDAKYVDYNLQLAQSCAIGNVDSFLENKTIVNDRGEFEEVKEDVKDIDAFCRDHIQYMGLSEYSNRSAPLYGW